MCVPECMPVHPPNASRSSRMSAEALDPLEVSLGCCELNLDPLQEQLMLLTTEPSLWP